MRKGDSTRARILNAAEREAVTRGLTSITLSEVAEASGLSKSGLFKHFDSKEAMQVAVLEHALARFAETVWRPVESLPRGRQRLEAIFEGWLTWGDETNAAGGCLILAASVELDDQPGPLRDLLQTNQQRWKRTLLREVQALRDPPVPEAEAAMAVFQIKSFVLGYNDARRLLQDSGARAAARAAYTSLLDRTQQGTAAPASA